MAINTSLARIDTPKAWTPQELELLNKNFFIIQEALKNSGSGSVGPAGPPGIPGTPGTPGTTSPLTTKGDIWGYDVTDNRIPIGVTNGHILMVDSAQALGLKWAADPNTGDVTLAGTPNYLTIVGQVITRALIDLASHITGRLPIANFVQATTNNRLLGRATAGVGNFEEITLGTNLTIVGTTLNAAGGGVTDHGALTGLADDDHTQYQLKSEKGAASGYASLDAGILVPTAQLADIIGAGTDATRFLRQDHQWEVPAGGSGTPTATTVEVNLGATAKTSGKFTITDATIGPSNKVLVWQAPGPYTSKGTRADEAEMQAINVIAVEQAAGNAVVKWQTPPLVIDIPLPSVNRDLITTAIRIGKAQGNIKFSYMVLA